jgi:cytochrome c
MARPARTAVNLTAFTTATLLSAMASTHVAAQDDGKLAFNNHCRTCHSVNAGDNRLGPTLNGVVGRKAGSVTEYPNYSQAIKSSGVTWDEATLDKFIAKPEAVVPNNNMKPYAGLPDADVRKQIIAFLQTLEQS